MERNPRRRIAYMPKCCTYGSWESYDFGEHGLNLGVSHCICAGMVITLVVWFLRDISDFNRNRLAPRVDVKTRSEEDSIWDCCYRVGSGSDLHHHFLPGNLLDSAIHLLCTLACATIMLTARDWRRLPQDKTTTLLVGPRALVCLLA